MRIAVASGKGGTGKTTASASLVRVWEKPVIAVDLDVEEPNLHLFLKPQITSTEKACMPVPVADESKCTYCRACADLCQFKAISVLGEVLLIFPEMCHGCGGCLAVCPQGALSTGSRELGEISMGTAGQAKFIMGRLRVGEAMSPPLMRAVKAALSLIDAGRSADVIVDAPPGVSCPAVNAVMDSDVILLVTEPTPFGLYDLRLAVEAFRPLGSALAVVVNRADVGDSGVADFCHSNDLPILAEIPYHREIAEAYAHGRVVADLPAFKPLFAKLAGRLRLMAQRNREAAHA